MPTTPTAPTADPWDSFVQKSEPTRSGSSADPWDSFQARSAATSTPDPWDSFEAKAPDSPPTTFDYDPMGEYSRQGDAPPAGPEYEKIEGDTAANVAERIITAGLGSFYDMTAGLPIQFLARHGAQYLPEGSGARELAETLQYSVHDPGGIPDPQSGAEGFLRGGAEIAGTTAGLLGPGWASASMKGGARLGTKAAEALRLVPRTPGAAQGLAKFGTGFAGGLGGMSVVSEALSPNPNLSEIVKAPVQAVPEFISHAVGAVSDASEIGERTDLTEGQRSYAQTKAFEPLAYGLAAGLHGVKAGRIGKLAGKVHKTAKAYDNAVERARQNLNDLEGKAAPDDQPKLRRIGKFMEAIQKRQVEAESSPLLPPEVGQKPSGELKAAFARARPGEATPLDPIGSNVQPPRETFGADLLAAIRVLVSRGLLKASAHYKHLGGKLLGVFKARGREGEIFTKDIRWSTVLAHELGHAIDYHVQGQKLQRSILARFPDLTITEGQARSELKRASEFYRPLRKGQSWGDRSSHMRYRAKSDELMADAMGLYLFDRAKLKELSPNVYESLERAIKQNPDVHAAVRAVLEPEAALELASKDVWRGNKPPNHRPPIDDLDHLHPDPEVRRFGYEIADKALREKSVDYHRLLRKYNKWTKNLTDAQLQDVSAMIEGIHNVKTNEPLDSILKRATPEMVRAAKDMAFEYEFGRQEENQLMRRIKGTPEHVKYVENYLPHFYVGTKKQLAAGYGRWKKQNPHAGQRTFPTLAEAVEAGLTPRTTNAAEIFALRAENSLRFRATIKMLHEIKELSKSHEEFAGFPLTTTKFTQGYTKFDHAVLRDLFYGGKIDGKDVLREAPVYVHPELVRPLKILLDNPIGGKAMQSIRAINSVGKAINIGLSFFHHFSLLESSLVNATWTNPLRGGLLSGREARKLGIGDRAMTTWRAGHLLDLKYPEMTEKGLLSGLTASDKARMDYAQGYLSNAIKSIETFADKSIGHGAGWLLRGPRKLLDANSRMLWDNMHTGLKLFTWHTMAAEALQKARPGESSKALLESLGSFINDAYGGQEHIRVPIVRRGEGPRWAGGLKLTWEPATPKETGLMKQLVFAIDWTVSNIRIAGRSAKAMLPGSDSVSRRFAIRYWRNMIVGMVGAANALQASVYASARAMGDDDPDLPWNTFNNGMAGIFDVDVTPIMRAWHRAWGHEPPRERLVVHGGKQFLEVGRWFTDTGQQAISKSSVLARIMYEQLTGETSGGFALPWKDTGFRDGLEGWEEAMSRAGNVAKHFTPFSLSGDNQFALTLPMRKRMTPWKAMVAYRDAFQAYIEPGMFDFDSEEERKEALNDLFGTLADEAGKNGIPPDELTRIQQAARSKVRSGYLADFYNAGNQDEANEALTRYATLGGDWDSFEQSMRSKFRGWQSPETMDPRKRERMMEAIERARAFRDRAGQ